VALLQSKLYKNDMRNEVILHDGVVKSIEGERVRVTILQSSACSGCAAKAMCSSAEAKEKEIDVVAENPQAYRVGQQVVLEGRLSDGRMAAMVAYGLPLLLLLPVLFVAIKISGSEAVGALWALGSVVLYYICVYLFFRRSLQSRFSFRIRTI